MTVAHRVLVVVNLMMYLHDALKLMHIQIIGKGMRRKEKIKVT